MTFKANKIPIHNDESVYERVFRRCETSSAFVSLRMSWVRLGCNTGGPAKALSASFWIACRALKELAF